MDQHPPPVPRVSEVMENEQTPLGRTVGKAVPSKDNPVSAEMGGRWRAVWEDVLEGLGICEGTGW